MVKGQVIFASFWKRVFAYFLDFFLLTFVILSPLIDPFESKFGENISEAFNFTFGWDYFFLTVVIGFLILLYWSVMECWFGQSIGKMFFGISVQSTNKKQISFIQAIIRNITKLSLILLFLDTFYMFIKKKHQRFFEVLSETQVVVEVVQ